MQDSRILARTRPFSPSLRTDYSSSRGYGALTPAPGARSHSIMSSSEEEVESGEEDVRKVPGVPCQVCNKADDDDQFVLCDRCDEGGSHFYCCEPKLDEKKLPEEWLCDVCKKLKDEDDLVKRVALVRCKFKHFGTHVGEVIDAKWNPGDEEVGKRGTSLMHRLHFLSDGHNLWHDIQGQDCEEKILPIDEKLTAEHRATDPLLHGRGARVSVYFKQQKASNGTVLVHGGPYEGRVIDVVIHPAHADVPLDRQLKPFHLIHFEAGDRHWINVKDPRWRFRLESQAGSKASSLLASPVVSRIASTASTSSLPVVERSSSMASTSSQAADTARMSSQGGSSQAATAPAPSRAELSAAMLAQQRGKKRQQEAGLLVEEKKGRAVKKPRPKNTDSGDDGSGGGGDDDEDSEGSEGEEDEVSSPEANGARSLLIPQATRDKSRQFFLTALDKARSPSSSGGAPGLPHAALPYMPHGVLQLTSEAIESAVLDAAKTTSEYTKKVRQLTFNLERNGQLSAELFTGSLTTQALVRMSTEDLASSGVKAERAIKREASFRAVTITAAEEERYKVENGSLVQVGPSVAHDKSPVMSPVKQEI